VLELAISIELAVITGLLVALYFSKSPNRFITGLKAVFEYRLIGPSDKKQILIIALIAGIISAVSFADYFISKGTSKAVPFSIPNLSEEQWVFLVIGNVIIVVIWLTLALKTGENNKN